jgi:hypothetical protein
MIDLYGLKKRITEVMARHTEVQQKSNESQIQSVRKLRAKRVVAQ